jgi:DNA-directed RNA polymerase delta subunit
MKVIIYKQTNKKTNRKNLTSLARDGQVVRVGFQRWNLKSVVEMMSWREASKSCMF